MNGILEVNWMARAAKMMIQRRFSCCESSALTSFEEDAKNAVPDCRIPLVTPDGRLSGGVARRLPTT